MLTGKEREGVNRSATFVIILEVILAVSVCLNVLFYTEMQSNMPSSNQAQFNREFGYVAIVSRNYDFSPPISMYKALRLALESDGWKNTSLQNMTVTVSLDFVQFYNFSNGFGNGPITEVTQPQQSYADVQVNSTTVDRYIWDISIEKNGVQSMPPWSLYYVDAQTGDIIPTGPLF